MLGFVLVSVGLIVIPGPNVLVIVATSLSHGVTRGLQTVAGTSLAMILQLVVAIAGTGWMMSAFDRGFLIIKWVGVLYLFYLGIRSLIVARSAQSSALSSAGSFQRGFGVALTNPKTILFFSAFLPQFVSGDGHIYWELGKLGGMFWVLALILDSSYAVLAHLLANRVQILRNQFWQQLFSGLLLAGAALLLMMV